MRHYQKVKEDIRAGRTELVWAIGPVLWQANNPNEAHSPFYVSKEIILKRKNFGWFTSTPFEDKHKIQQTFRDGFKSIEEAKADCQDWYNNFLLDQAKKLDEQGHFQRKEVVK